jgi:hypothetical protein
MSFLTGLRGVLNKLMNGFRLATLDDCDAMTEVESAAWTDVHAAPSSTIRRRIERFPTMTLLSIDSRGKIAGFFFGIPVPQAECDVIRPWAHYAALALDDTYHVGRYSDVYSLSLTVHPGAPPGTATKLVAAYVAHLTGKGYARLISVTRAPRFKALNMAGVSFPDYYAGLISGIYREPLYHIFVSTNAVLNGYIADYFPDDESLDYGLIFVHDLSNSLKA